MDSEKNVTYFRVESGTVMKVILVSFILWLAFFLRDIVLVIVMAVVVASSIEPSAKWFIKRKVPRTLAVLIIYFALVLIFIGGFYFLVIPLIGDTQQFLGALPDYLG